MDEKKCRAVAATLSVALLEHEKPDNVIVAAMQSEDVTISAAADI